MDLNKQNKINDTTKVYAYETFRPVPVTRFIHFEWYVIFEEEDYKEKLKRYGFR